MNRPDITQEHLRKVLLNVAPNIGKTISRIELSQCGFEMKYDNSKLMMIIIFTDKSELHLALDVMQTVPIQTHEQN